MFCRHCGREIKEGADSKFCPGCGKPLSEGGSTGISIKAPSFSNINALFVVISLLTAFGAIGVFLKLVVMQLEVEGWFESQTRAYSYSLFEVWKKLSGLKKNLEYYSFSNSVNEIKGSVTIMQACVGFVIIIFMISLAMALKALYVLFINQEKDKFLDAAKVSAITCGIASVLLMLEAGAFSTALKDALDFADINLIKTSSMVIYLIIGCVANVFLITKQQNVDNAVVEKTCPICHERYIVGDTCPKCGFKSNS